LAWFVLDGYGGRCCRALQMHDLTYLCTTRSFTSRFSEIYVHGMGAAVHQAINLALRLQAEAQGTLLMHVDTSTVVLVDDLVPTEEVRK
jgi:hypothetical protein